MQALQIALVILGGILGFGLLIFIHEFGHFITAKLHKIKVNEFALGMGPKIFSFVKGETRYSLRLFPIGGFCSMEGEDEESDDDRAFNKKSAWRRITVVAAGAFFNFVLGFILVLIIVCCQDLVGTTVVAQFEENSVSDKSGLQLMDEIVGINGHRVFVWSDLTYDFVRDADGIVSLDVIRDGKQINLPAVKFEMGKTEDGQTYIVRDFKVYGQRKNIGNVLKATVLESISIGRVVWRSLFDLVTGNVPVSELSGPIGVTSAVGESILQGTENGFTLAQFLNILDILAMISINLGIFNLLPLPALDGGRLIFLILEGIRRKPINPKYEGYVHLTGLALLLLLMVFVTFNDITRLVGKIFGG